MATLYESKNVFLNKGEPALDVLANKANLMDSSEIDIDLLEASFDLGVLFFDAYCTPLRAKNMEEARLSGAIHMITPTGYEREGREILASFTYRAGVWIGPFWGTIYELLTNYETHGKYAVTRDPMFKDVFRLRGFGYKEVKDYNNKGLSTKVSYPDKEENYDLIKEIKNQLEDANKLENDLGTCLPYYIRNVLHRVYASGTGIIYNPDKTMSIINTGLTDVYGNYIYLLDRMASLNKEDFEFKELVGSLSRLSSYGFVFEDFSGFPDPPVFYNDVSELVFDARTSYGILIELNAVNHIDKERRNRLPEVYREISTRSLLDAIRNSVRDAIHISKVNPFYIIPIYYATLDTISYLLPLKIGSSREVTNALVVHKCNGVYTLKTIYTLSQAYQSALFCCDPESTWITRKEGENKNDKDCILAPKCS